MRYGLLVPLLMLAAPALADANMGALAPRLPGVKNDDTWMQQMSDLGFSMTNAVKPSAYTLRYTDGAIDGSGSVSVDLAINPLFGTGGYAGLLFGYRSPRDFNLFALDAAGKATIYRMQDGSYGPILSSGSDGPHPAIRHLALEIEGDRVSFLLDGDSIATMTTGGLGGGQVGIIAVGIVQSSFANFAAEADGAAIRH